MKVLLTEVDHQSAEKLKGEIRAWDPTWLVDIATEADEAISLIEADEYQVVIWEISTPGSAGLLTLRRLREARPYTALIVTAFPGAEALAAQSLSEGADAYLIRRPDWSRNLLTILGQAEFFTRRHHQTEQLEQALQRLRVQHEAVLDSVPQPLLVLAAEGRIEACNQAAANLLGRPRERLVGNSFGSLLLAPGPLNVLLSCLGDAWATLPSPGPGLMAAWREEDEVAAQALVRDDLGRYRLCTLRLRTLAKAPGSDVLVSLTSEGEEQVKVAGPPGSPAEEALWQAPGLYVVRVDGEDRIARIGAGLSRALGDKAEALVGLPASELFEPQALTQIQLALEVERRYQGEIGVSLTYHELQPCWLSVTAVGTEAGGDSLWIALPRPESEPPDHGLQMERSLVSLARAVSHLEGVHDPHDLPDQILSAVDQLLHCEVSLCHLDLAVGGEKPQAIEAQRGLAPVQAREITERLEALLRGGKLPAQALVISDLEEYCRRTGEASLQETLAAEGLTSAVWIPIKITGEPVGSVFLAERRGGAFQPWLHRVLDLLGAEIGRAAAGAILYHQTQTTAGFAQQLLRISVALNSRNEVEEVLRKVAEAAVNLSGGVCCWVELLDEQAQQFESTFRYCPDPGLAQALYVEVHKVAWEAVEQQKSAQTQAQDDHGIRYQLAALPLVVDGKVVGVMTLGCLESAYFSTTAHNALQILATQAGVAVRKMQLLALAMERAKRMEAAAVQARAEEARARTVLQAAASVTESREVGEALAQIARSAAKEIGFERVGIFLADYKAGVLRGQVEVYSDGSSLDLSAQTVALRAGGDLLAEVALSSAPYMICSLPAGEGPAGGSYEQLLMPMRVDGELVGIITADNRSSQHAISPQQTRLLRALAAMAAVAIGRAQMDEAREALISAVSHELRRPLASIRAYNELLLDGDAGPVNEEQQTYLQRVEEACQRLGRMVEDLLDWAKLRSGKITGDKRAVDLEEIVRGVVNQLQGKAQQAQITLSVTAEEELAPVETDPRLLEQILSNLVDNAIKFNNSGAAVTVSIRSEAEAAVVGVQDTGPGIPPEFHRKIFEEFERGPAELHGQTEGTGLGLPIAARLAAYLGGSLHLESEPGQGSTFSVRLPYAPEPDEAGEEGKSAESGE